MLSVVKNTWALLLGMLLLMLGNGMQSTLLGIRGEIEGFSTTSMSMVMSAYFIGFLGGSRMAPELIRRVGHVRVFAALGSIVSAILVLYAVVPHPAAWFIMRVIIGFCFSGVYVVAESWMNDNATNETRGQVMSVYIIMQMAGIVAAQMLLNTSDPAGFVLFVVASVLVSVSFAPILLSVSPAPAYQTTKAMKLRKLIKASPLGCVSMFLLGGVFSVNFGMSPIYGAQVGMSVQQISIFVAMIYVGGFVCQFPIGWLSDKMDRRLLIAGLTMFGSLGLFAGMILGGDYYLVLGMAFLIGGISNPLYSLYIAHTNDFLDHDDMAAASGGLIFINAIGAITGPLIVGWMMERFGAGSYFFFLALLLAIMAIYAIYRMTQRATVDRSETMAYQAVSPTSTIVAIGMAQEHVIEQALDDEGNTNTEFAKEAN